MYHSDMNITQDTYTRACPNCLITLDFSEFYTMFNGVIYFTEICKKCSYQKRVEASKARKIKDAVAILRNRVFGMIRAEIKKQSHIYVADVERYLPYTIQDLKIHLEKQFDSWMNWTNWGKYIPKYWDDNDSSTWKWQVDHIEPRSTLVYSSVFDDNFKKCWALENLRPYSAKANLLDGVRRVRY
jgi:hypothetical protein